MRVMNHTESKKPAGESMNTNNCWLAIDVTPCQAINCVVNNKSNGISRKNSAPLIKRKLINIFQPLCWKRCNMK